MNFKFRGKVNTKPLKEAKSDDEDFENYDMYVFITNLFTRDHKEIYKRPLNPLGRPHKHFDYVPKDEDRSAPSPVTSTVDGDILITTPNEKDFDDVKAICDKYKFNYEVYPNGKYWSCEIEVPSYSPGYPMLVEDYFEDLGMSVDDVMPSWYSKQMAKAGVGVNESMQNIDRIVDDKSVDPSAILGPTMTRAQQFRKEADKEVEKRMKEHEKATGVKRGEVFTGAKKQPLPKKVEEPKKETLSESLFEDVKPDEATIKADLQTALRKKGLKLNPSECGIDDAVENIMMSNGELTVDEWIKETQRNYPKCFEESITEATHKLDGGYIDLEAEDEDFENAFSKFLSEVGADRIPDATSYREHGWIYMYFLLNGKKEEFCYHTSNDYCDATFNDKYVAKSKAGDTLDNIIKIYNAKKNGSRRESNSLSEAYGPQEANQILDTFLSYVDEGIVDTKEALLSLIRWLSVYEAAEFIKVNDYVPDDDLYESKSLKESEQDEINAFTDEYWDKYESICRYLDVEIPDKCGEVRDYVNTAAGEQMSMHSLDYILGKCRRFNDDLEYVLK